MPLSSMMRAGADTEAVALPTGNPHDSGMIRTRDASLPTEYPLCTTATATGPCMGVVGAADPTQRCVVRSASSTARQEGAPACDDWAYGASTEIMDRLRSKSSGLDFDTSCGTSPATLGAVDKNGKCVPCGDTAGCSCVSADKIGTKHLLINDGVLAAAAANTQDADYWKDFPLQTLHKIWGDGDPQNSFNNGVHSRNVYLSPSQETVQCTPDVSVRLGWPTPSSAAQQPKTVLVLEAHGNAYTGDKTGVKVPGLHRKPKELGATNPQSCSGVDMPRSQEYNDWTDDPTRVGGIVTTRQAYGPGVYNVLAYVSPTTDTVAGGRGYVFAIWPFHYAEVYNDATTTPDAQPTQARGNLKGPKSDAQYPCFAQCDGGTADSEKCTTVCGGSEDDLLDVINHEIDIEIPSNAPGATTENDPATGKDRDWSLRTWDTMNINTWINDIGNYDMDTGAYYQNLGVTRKQSLADSTGSKRSRAPSSPSTPSAPSAPSAPWLHRLSRPSVVSNPSGPASSFVSTDGFWHWYTIDWYVNNDDYKQNYVAVYFDDPFDPSGNAVYNNMPLPTKPTGVPLANTHRFVPTRFGRLNIGPWFGHWGYDGTSQHPANFDTAYVGVAHISISPQTTSTDPTDAPTSGFLFPQSYDQAFVDNNKNTIYLQDDFANMYSQGFVPVPPSSPLFPPAPPVNPPNPPPIPPASSGMSPVTISLVVLGCLLVVALATVLAVFVQAKKRANK